MNEKINVAELLKDCPSGMELDCLLYDNVTLKSVSDKHTPFPIKVLLSDGCQLSLTEYGEYTYTGDAKCIIYPKGKTTWEGFQRPFKDGDIIHVFDEYSDESFTYLAILKQIEKDGKINSHCFYNYEDDEFSTHDFLYDCYNIRFATEEEKQKLFRTIKENGYRWNAETKTLEKLIKSEFKVGDVIEAENRFYKYRIIKITNTHYTLETIPGAIIHNVEICEDKNMKLVPNKFDITTLKPFESRVLVRTNKRKWVAAFYSHYDEDASLHYCVVGGLWYEQCIPYNGNEHLLNTTDDCDEYYKNWEE